MTTPTVAVDAVEAVRAWINAQPTLVGAGQPLPLGAHRWRERSPGQGAYAFLVLAGGGPDPTEAPIQQARVSASVYAGTLDAARTAAIALFNAYAATVWQPNPTVTWPDGSALLLAVDDITGPQQLPDTEPGYLVDAVFTLQPIP